jgi:integrase
MKPPKVETRLREAVRARHYSLKTEDAYVMWYKQFVRFHGLRHPDEMAEAEVTAFLKHLSVERKVAVSTHRQALNALVFLFQQVLGRELQQMPLWRPRRPQRVPVVLTVDEARAVLAAMKETEALMARLLYGCGLRLMECLRLRVKDVDVDGGMLTVRAGKGDKDRMLELPESIRPALRVQLSYARQLWQADRAAEAPGVEIPHGFSVKSPQAGKKWPWFWLFPADL